MAGCFSCVSKLSNSSSYALVSNFILCLLYIISYSPEITPYVMYSQHTFVAKQLDMFPMEVSSPPIMDTILQPFFSTKGARNMPEIKQNWSVIFLLLGKLYPDIFQKYYFQKMFPMFMLPTVFILSVCKNQNYLLKHNNTVIK